MITLRGLRVKGEMEKRAMRDCMSQFGEAPKVEGNFFKGAVIGVFWSGVFWLIVVVVVLVL